MSSESRSEEALGAMQKPWQVVSEVSSFADLRFAKTDYSGVDVGDSMFDTLTVESGGFFVRGDVS